MCARLNQQYRMPAPGKLIMLKNCKLVCPLFICSCRCGFDDVSLQCRQKKNIMKEMNQKQLEVLREMSSWCLQDLGSKSNRTKVSAPWKEDLYLHRERRRGCFSLAPPPALVLPRASAVACWRAITASPSPPFSFSLLQSVVKRDRGSVV